jgi:hypothetical protein
VLAPSRDQAPVTDFLSSTPLTAFRRALARVLALLVGFGPLAAHAQAAGTAAVKPLVATVATPSASRPNAALRWTRLGNPRSPSLLQVPADCQVRSCPLVVVSHPRAQDAARLRDSAQVGKISQALLAADFAVLLSGDGGVNTWGSPAALREVAQVHREATSRFRWNSRTYALGLSMGGLLSLRSALPDSPYTVRGVALIDAWVSLRGAWGSALSRQREIGKAYGLTVPPTPTLDPLPLAQRLAPVAPLPLFLAYSPTDTVVSSRKNAELLIPKAEQGVSEIVRLDGPHLGGNRFSPQMIARLVGFYQGLEQRAIARQHKEFPPGLPAPAVQRAQTETSKS